MPAQDYPDDRRFRAADSLYGFSADLRFSAADFFAAVGACAARLPSGNHAINICNSRLSFAIGFFAALLRGHTNILLPGQAKELRQSALQSFGGAYVLDESYIDACSAGGTGCIQAALRDIDPEHIAAIVFSSGTTGLHKQIAKTWRSLYQGAQANARCLQNVASGGMSAVATVPMWHMYGLEWTVMLPLASELSICTHSALFPDDIRECLLHAPKPRLLLSTPLHLRALFQSELVLPDISVIMSATAPLDVDFARQMEDRWGARALEIYGCSELGSMAFRLPSRDPLWHFLPEFSCTVEGEVVNLRAEHTGPMFELADKLEFVSEKGFRIAGRDIDMVKVAGKRGSLADINACLLALPGVVDGFVYDPSQLGLPATGRLAAVVVAEPGVTGAEVRAGLQGKVDPAFIPRPVYIAAKIPRSETGKLRLADLHSLVRELSKRSNRA
jgi:acyl-coenzyme A synthetase/AMP-(fatty) acid ligase